MPVIEPSTYTPPFIFRNCHLHTLYPPLFRQRDGVNFSRERLELPDGDFLDLDWAQIGSDSLVLAIHGLEGSSHSQYMPSIIRAFNRRGWDGVAMNLRGCSGDLNRLLRFYHAGSTDDVHAVVQHIVALQCYRRLILVGFSIGGNLTLKYLGEQGTALPSLITGAAAVSTPCDLTSSATKLAERSNILYMKNFLRCFRRKIRQKMQIMPEQISDEGFEEIKNFKDYDDRYTAPLHGFTDAQDYWTHCSSKQFLSAIRVPTLMISALDDPFLGKACYPFAEAEANPMLFLETPSFGGHVAFVARNPQGEYWHETRIMEFLLSMYMNNS